MTVLIESLDVRRSVAEVFAYVSDFTTTQEWDPAVLRSRQLTQGPVAVGTCFEVICSLPVGSIALIYEVTAFQHNELFEQHGRSRLFEIHDSICFEPTAVGTRINYKSEIIFTPWLRPLAACSKKALEKMGRESMQGLGAALGNGVDVSRHHSN
jgi:dehydrogenase/reductase SDR family protein 12